MENERLYILRLILACVILNAIIATVEAKKYSKHSNVPAVSKTDVQNREKHQEYSRILKKTHPKHSKKSKRSAYGRSWSAKEYSYMPPFLVFNRKTGAYYPYYTHNENNNRRTMPGKSWQRGVGI